MSISKKRLGIGMLSLLCAVCLLFGWMLTDKDVKTTTANAEGTMTVEDIYDVTSRADNPMAFFDGISNWATFSGYQSAVTENYEFTAHMVLSFEFNKEFVFGIMANGENGGQGSYDGYWFVMNEVSDTSNTADRTMKLFTKKQYFNNQSVTLTNVNGELDTLWAQMLNQDGFDFAMGVQSKTDESSNPYTYVYVKINGSIVIEYDNYNTDNVVYGNYIYADSYARATIYANKNLVTSEATVENIFGFMPLINYPEFDELHARNVTEIIAPGEEFNRGIYRPSSTDMGDVSMIMPSLHGYCGGFCGTAHTDGFLVTAPERAYVDSAKMLALDVIDLLFGDASRGKEIAALPPMMSKTEYLQKMRSFSSTVEYP